jgi:hypothetical protein
MSTIIGFLIGYAFGTRAGQEGWAETKAAWKVISTSEEVRDLAAGGLQTARQRLGQRGGALAAMLAGGEGTGLRPVA